MITDCNEGIHVTGGDRVTSAWVIHFKTSSKSGSRSLSFPPRTILFLSAEPTLEFPPANYLSPILAPRPAMQPQLFVLLCRLITLHRPGTCPVCMPCAECGVQGVSTNSCTNSCSVQSV